MTDAGPEDVFLRILKGSLYYFVAPSNRYSLEVTVTTIRNVCNVHNLN